MRKSLLTVFTFLLISLNLQAQEERPVLSKSGPSFIFPSSFQIDNTYAAGYEVEELLAGQTKALDAFQKYRRRAGLQMGFTIAGGLIGSYPIYKSIFGGEPDYTYLAIGGGVIVASWLVFSQGISKRMDEVIRLYEQGHSNKGSRAKLSFGMQSMGIGLKLGF